MRAVKGRRVEPQRISNCCSSPFLDPPCPPYPPWGANRTYFVLPTTFPLRMHTQDHWSKMEPPNDIPLIITPYLSRYRYTPIVTPSYRVLIFFGLCDPSLTVMNITRRTCKKLRVDDAMHNIGQQMSPMTHHRLLQLMFVYTYPFYHPKQPPEGS